MVQRVVELNRIGAVQQHREIAVPHGVWNHACRSHPTHVKARTEVIAKEEEFVAHDGPPDGPAKLGK